MPHELAPQRIAVIYDRASRQQQANNYARDDAARLSTLAEGMNLPWDLRQEIKSGEHLNDRPVMKQLLQEVEAGRVAAIVCQDFTRLSRDEDGIMDVSSDRYAVIITASSSPRSGPTISPWTWMMTWLTLGSSSARFRSVKTSAP